MVTSTDPHPDEDLVQSEDHEHWGGTSRHVWPIVVKVLFLGTVIALAISITPMLVAAESWLFLLAVWAIAAVLLATYATQRFLPFKYLVPGLLMLALFVVYPIILTAQTSLTNYGDGTRSTKEETVAQIIGSSVVQTPDAPRYNLERRDRELGDHRPVHLLPRQPGGRHPLQGHRGRARGARPGRRHGRERQDHRRRRLHVPDRQGGQRGRGRHQGVHRADRGRRDPCPRHHDGLRRDHHPGVRRGGRHDHRRHHRHGLHRAAAGRPRVLRRRCRQPGVRPVLEGQRRAGQLQEAAHQLRDPQRLHQHLHLDLPLRDAVGGDDVHPRAAAGDDASTTRGCAARRSIGQS